MRQKKTGRRGGGWGRDRRDIGMKPSEKDALQMHWTGCGASLFGYSGKCSPTTAGMLQDRTVSCSPIGSCD